MYGRSKLKFLLLSHLTFVSCNASLFCFGVNSRGFREIWIIRIYRASSVSFLALISFYHFRGLVILPSAVSISPRGSAPGTLAACAQSIRPVLVALIYTAICVMHELRWKFSPPAIAAGASARDVASPPCLRIILPIFKTNAHNWRRNVAFWQMAPHLRLGIGGFGENMNHCNGVI